MMQFRIKDVSFGEMYYGTSDINSIIPKTLPYKFQKNQIEPWNTVALDWFKQGIRKESILIPVYGIDKEKAMKHIQCLFNTWFLTKDQKIKNASFLLSIWFTSITL
jgi:hypothetical protein